MEGAGGAIGAARDAIGRGAPAGGRSGLGSRLEGGVRLPEDRVGNAWSAVAGGSGRWETRGRRSPGLFARGDRLGGARRPERGRGNVFPALVYASAPWGTRRRGSPARPTQKNRLGERRPHDPRRALPWPAVALAFPTGGAACSPASGVRLGHFACRPHPCRRARRRLGVARQSKARPVSSLRVPGSHRPPCVRRALRSHSGPPGGDRRRDPRAGRPAHHVAPGKGAPPGREAVRAQPRPVRQERRRSRVVDRERS